MKQPNTTGKTIGILALQGDYEAHRRVLEERLHLRTEQVRRPGELERVDALVLPGGESTTIAKLLDRAGLIGPIRDRARAGMPVYGTCAGMILMADEIADRPDQPTLGLMDITVARNAFGRQVDSFEAELSFTGDGEENAVRGVFIRAPYVSRSGPEVNVVATFEDRVVGVRQGSLLATAFHPELTDNDRVHALFAHMVAESGESR
jgi:5'-phosphate synthase pdxT subunit